MTFLSLTRNVDARDSLGNPAPDADVTGLSRQIILVLADDWNSTNGWLRRFDLRESGWAPAGPPVRVSLGRNGLAWGNGRFPKQRGLLKKEGDGRSPAGVFSLPFIFGKRSPDAMKGLHMPYVQCTPSLECVDDPKSFYYNQVVDRADIPHPDWHSSEKMLSSGDEYGLGVFVGHNYPATPGLGSCVFLHIWAAPGHPTGGCTAMAAGDLESLAVWMDHSASPILIQLPQSEYARLRQPWGLPNVSTNAP